MVYEFVFQNNQKGVITVSSDLLDTEARAKQRAIAEFIVGGVEKKEILFSTYRTNINVGDFIVMAGVTYRVMTKMLKVTQKSMITTIQGVSYVT